MLKKPLITLCLVSILLLAGCMTELDRPNSIWLMGDEEVATAMIGTRVTRNNEVGILYQTYPNNLDDDSDLFGAYAAYHFPDLVQMPNPFGGESTDVSAFIGAQTTIDENYIDQISPFVGFIFWDFLVVKYENDAFDNRNSSDEQAIIAGLRFRF